MKKIDLVGRSYGRLRVVKFSHRAGHHLVWRCQCRCGSSVPVFGCNLTRGFTKSCGCLNKELAKARGLLHATHGHTKNRRPTGAWSSWWSMLQRCLNKNNPRFKDYGGRGITVCKRWLKFENFFADMKQRPARRTLDRKNNGKGYYKRNCRWATYKEQASNRRPRR